jgi:hypothetical protein
MNQDKRHINMIYAFRALSLLPKTPSYTRPGGDGGHWVGLRAGRERRSRPPIPPPLLVIRCGIEVEMQDLEYQGHW